MIALAAVVALAACGDKPQTAASVKASSPSWQGVGNGFVAPGWKPGDARSWEEHLNNRTQRGQNEYTRFSGAS